MQFSRKSSEDLAVALLHYLEFLKPSQKLQKNMIDRQNYFEIS